LITMPILERYLRETSACAEGSLGDEFYEYLLGMFSELESLDQARQFWQTYRNGLLHQLAFSLQDRKGSRMPPACITFDQEDAISTLEHGQFVVNPISFSKRVTSEINSDYREMVGTQSPNHPLPFVFVPSGSISFTGTASDERWKQ